METETVQMTAEEREEYEAFRAAKMKKEAAERLRQDREAYKQLVNETVNSIFPSLEDASRMLADRKKEVYERFKQALQMKAELYEKAAKNKSNTFINNECTLRITLGQYEVDGYDDTVNEGEAKVRAFIATLPVDTPENSFLVNTLLERLAKDKKGNMNPKSILLLRKEAEKLGNETLLDGVRIIEDAYRPQLSKCYVKAERKNENGQWVNVPLGMTES